VDFARRWSEKTEIAAGRFIGWLDVVASKFVSLRPDHLDERQRMSSGVHLFFVDTW
jgi:hypothetical protein